MEKNLELDANEIFDAIQKIESLIQEEKDQKETIQKFRDEIPSHEEAIKFLSKENDPDSNIDNSNFLTNEIPSLVSFF